MTAPEGAARILLAALVMGFGLGIWYGLLGPLRVRHTHLADLLFCPGAVWAWLVLSFDLCRGDLRLAYTAALALGVVLWEGSLGRWLRPGYFLLCRGIWKVFTGIFRKWAKSSKKIYNFMKILFASWKK